MNSQKMFIYGAAGVALFIAADKFFMAVDAATNSDTGGSTVSTGDLNSNILSDTWDKVTSGSWPNGSAPYQGLIQSAADDNGVPALILAWLLWKECRYNPDIIDGAINSPVGAMGIAQFMPATAQQILGSTGAALDPSHAVPGAARYLASMYRQLGAWDLTLAAYNWGIGNVQRKGIAAAPPETVDYYTTIMSYAGVTA